MKFASIQGQQTRHTRDGVKLIEGRQMITPDQAAQLLAGVPTYQRSFSPQHAKKLAVDMRAGRWHHSNDQIVVDTNCALVNGQHRMSATVASGAPQPFTIMIVEPEEAERMFAEMDQGKTRSVSDFLKSHGVHDYAMTGAIARGGFAYDRGAQVSTMIHGRPDPTRHELIKWVDENPQVIEACRLVREMGAAGLRPNGRVHGVLSFLTLRDVQEFDASEFWHEVATGDTLYHSGAWWLRDRMFRQQAEKGTMPLKNLKLADAIVCWNLWTDQATRERMSWWKPGSKKTFPACRYIDAEA